MRRKYAFPDRESAESAYRRSEDENVVLQGILARVLRGEKPAAKIKVDTDILRGWALNNAVDGLWLVSVRQEDGHETIAFAKSGLSIIQENRESNGISWSAFVAHIQDAVYNHRIPECTCPDVSI